MSPSARDLACSLYRLVASLPIRHFSDLIRKTACPASGIYLLFQAGETVDVDGGLTPRIVRVGTHLTDGHLRRRLRNHYGAFKSLNGNKNGSALRRHLGGALLRRQGANDLRLAGWDAQGGESCPEVERQVSQYLRDNFSFRCIGSPFREERELLETGLIALLAQAPLAEPSAEWLGRFAKNTNIRASGLWNSDDVDGRPLSGAEFERLATFVEATCNGRAG